MSEQFVANDGEQDFYDPHRFIFIQSRATINYALVDEYAKIQTRHSNRRGMAVLPNFVKEKQRAGEFIWFEPQLERQPCTPQSCKHAHSTPSGFVVLVEPGGNWKMACVHQECRGQAQEALLDWEAKHQQLEQQRQLWGIGRET
jgi:hypothetical protein